MFSTMITIRTHQMCDFTHVQVFVCVWVSYNMKAREFLLEEFSLLFSKHVEERFWMLMFHLMLDASLQAVGTVALFFSLMPGEMVEILFLIGVGMSLVTAQTTPRSWSFEDKVYRFQRLSHIQHTQLFDDETLISMLKRFKVDEDYWWWW